MSGMFEIQSSEAVLGKTQDPKVREFAEHMVRDHREAANKLKAAVKGQSIPASLDQEHADKLKQLQQATGQDLNNAYVTMQLAGHQQAVRLFDNYARDGDDASLKQFAQQTLPTLSGHLQSITQIQASSAGQQPDRTASSAQPGGMPDRYFITHSEPNIWRASKLVGVDVYNENRDKIGDINEVLIDGQGKIDAVVIGVGGFLGIGEHNVAVPFNSLQWSTRPINARTSTTTTVPATRPDPVTTSAVPPATAPSTSTVGGASTADSLAIGAYRGYPDHAVLPNASKDQLKAAPAFIYGPR